MYAAMHLDDHGAFGTRKGHDDMALDGVDRILAYLLLRLHVCADLVWNQQTKHKFIYGNH